MIDASVKAKAMNDISRGKLHFDVARQYGVSTKTLFAWTTEAESEITEKGFAAVMSSLKRFMSL